MNKVLKLTFLASLVLNVLFIGVLLGQLPNRVGGGSSSPGRIETAAQQLPEPARSRFRNQMEQLRAEVQPLREQIQEARNSALRALAAEPFDGVAFDRQVSQISELRVQISKRMAERMKEVVKDLPADQRQVLAEAFKRPSTSRR
jgi:uncharacterized membrane protein